MFQIRFHGRGGQGVVTAAEMLSVAAFLEGKHAQAFPSFGSERMGAPVVSFCRIDNREIRTRDPIYDPNALIVQDPTLLQSPDLFTGLRHDGFVLVNSGRDLADLGISSILNRLPPGHVMAVPATEIALKHIKRPLPNAVMLGGFVALSGLLGMESVEAAINRVFSGPIAQANIEAAREAFALVKDKRSEQGTFHLKEAIAC